jgi:hypothetical protein
MLDIFIHILVTWLCIYWQCKVCIWRWSIEIYSVLSVCASAHWALLHLKKECAISCDGEFVNVKIQQSSWRHKIVCISLVPCAYIPIKKQQYTSSFQCGYTNNLPDCHDENCKKHLWCVVQVKFWIGCASIVVIIFSSLKCVGPYW